MKRRGFLTLTAFAPFLLSGCLTSQLIDEANSDNVRQYTETIDSVLISADRKKLVFLGAEYHYIFDAPEHFVELLASPLHSLIRADVSSFSVIPDENVDGYIDLKVPKSSALTPQQKEQLVDFGFSGTELVRQISLKGARYDARKFERSRLSSTSLNQSYSVRVHETQHSSAKKAMLLMTPVTVALDGALMILAVPLIPVGIYLFSNMRLVG
ncbi:hypothetical protein P9239_23050 [Caballeronia sp. LZ062]|uniref:hypothetical protein n=1 Tax=unclassified Caballeronia TaxID=2646786 RepID=UPI002860D007|nr:MULTISPECIES: hypothetical protein [unclassified Caballeronia]MDR5856565.1 hypothetical protein [Caballeronia sp. LZ050]MDR5873235.1 hypothetical protein [Caballeronia sp. LZ062]